MGALYIHSNEGETFVCLRAQQLEQCTLKWSQI